MEFECTVAIDLEKDVHVEQDGKEKENIFKKYANDKMRRSGNSIVQDADCSKLKINHDKKIEV